MVDINDISQQKEYYDLVNVKATEKTLPIGYNDYDYLKTVQTELLQLQGHQIFIKNLFNPHTKYRRLLLYHSTGTGKTIVILSVAESYIRYLRKMKQQPSFVIIGFTEDIIVRELLKYPELGYITDDERDELNNLRYSNSEKDIARRRGLKSSLKRRITDKTRGGYYKFYGYQKFANDIFIITVKGIEEKITHNYIYQDGVNFYKRIEEEIKNKNIEINRSLIESLKYSFIACDEIHNTYNTNSKNNRGMAIDYVLRLLDAEDPCTSPKVIYASATPLTGSSTEIVDLMDLLIPGETFEKRNFFNHKGDFLPDSLERIGKICDGYVSFLKDTDVTQYPERIIEGVPITGIDYLKFIKCPMNTFMENTLREIKDLDNVETLLSTGNYTLYDIAFPNPNSKTVGLYNSNKIVSTISNASDKWKNDIGIHIEGTGIIGGDFLSYKHIGKYSTKYKTLLDKLFDIVDGGEIGKVIIYHYFVGTSGVLLINQMLLQNGFLDATSAPISTTRCVVCGVELGKHKKLDHPFKPVRILMAYGEIGGELDKTLSIFNDKRNIYGEEYKILIGSRVIHEGIDFNSVRFMFILSLPRDISTLIQVFGRAIRRRSHILLPEKYRNVHINILISTFIGDGVSPEVLNYKKKMNVYLKIQLIERELRRYAIDNFINFDKMNLSNKPSLDGLPYTPTFQFKWPKQKPFSQLTTFSAFGYSLVEERTIVTILKKLFAYRPVWIEKDLWYNIQHPFPQIKTPYDHSTFAKENFYLALDFLVNGTYIENLNSLTLNQDVHTSYISIGNESRRVACQGCYYILCPTDIFGAPIIDYDSYMRLDLSNVDTSISLTEYVDTELGERTFNNILDNYIRNYSKDPIMSLAKLHPNFHYTICKKHIEGYTIKGTEKLIELYDEIDALIYYDSFLSDEISQTFGIKEKRAPVGFKTQNMSFIYVNKKWEQITTTLLRIKKYEEQEWVGFSKVLGGEMDFKIRPGLEYMKATTDRRKLDRGRSCVTLPSGVLNKIARFLGVDIRKAKEACDIILRKIITLQIAEVQKIKSKRYYFFYFSVYPNL